LGWLVFPLVSLTLLAPTFELLEPPVAPVPALLVPLVVLLVAAELRDLLRVFACVPPLPVPLPSGFTPGCVELLAFVSFTLVAPVGLVPAVPDAALDVAPVFRDWV
jgi:hypothetical protein